MEGQNLYREPDTVAKRRKPTREPGATGKREGEHWPHPGDTEDKWPGVSASHCEVREPPLFSSGGISGQGENASYVWMPLARRVDLDRVFHAMMEHPQMFENVRPTGEGGFLYKNNPWAHMNPYHIRVSALLPAGPVEVLVGVTDHWEKHTQSRRSESGAKVYVQTKPEAAAPALRMVCAVLEEEDIEIPGDRCGALVLAVGGRLWGRERNVNEAARRAQWEQRLGAPAAAGVFAAASESMPLEEVRALLESIARASAAEPQNSSFCRFAQSLAARLAQILSSRLDQEWGHGVDLAAQAANDVIPGCGLQGVPTPAAGYHDAAAFPELNAQPIPSGHENAHLQEADWAGSEEEEEEEEEEEDDIAEGAAEEAPSVSAGAREGSVALSVTAAAREGSVVPSASAGAREEPAAPSVSAGASEGSMALSASAEAREGSVPPSVSAGAREGPAAPSASAEAREGSVALRPSVGARDGSGAPSVSAGAREGSVALSASAKAREGSVVSSASAGAREEPAAPSVSAGASEGDASQDEAREGDANLDDANCLAYTCAMDFGWNGALSTFTGIDREGFEALVPALRLDLCSEDLRVRSRLADAIEVAVQSMHRRGVQVPQVAVQKHVEQMRKQHFNLLRRRAAFLKRWPLEEIKESTAESFMKEHRNAHFNSEVQRRFRELDVNIGMRQHQVLVKRV